MKDQAESSGGAPGSRLHRLTRLLEEVTREPGLAAKLNEETLLLDGGVNLDSLTLTELLLTVEDQFEMEIDFTRLDRPHLRTVGSLLRFLETPAA